MRGFRQRAWRIVDSTICAVTTRPDTFASSGMLSRKVCITVELGSDAIGSGHLAVTV
nr:23S rRNA methyltransferase [Cutibacterium acnes]